MNETTYTNKDLKTIVALIEDWIDELDEWNEHNDNRFENETDDLREAFNELEYKTKRV